jgi:hypothetical protein
MVMSYGGEFTIPAYAQAPTRLERIMLALLISRRVLAEAGVKNAREWAKDAMELARAIDKEFSELT